VRNLCFVKVHVKPNALTKIAGVEIRGRPIVRDHHFSGNDDHVLIDGSPSDDLILALLIVLYEEGPLSFGRDYHVLTDGSPSDDLIVARIIVLYEEGPLSFGRD
jgi:predicted HTH domain antitoxin